MKRNYRNRIFVKKTLQIKYTLIILVAMLVTAATVGADFYFSLHSFINEYLKEMPGIDALVFNMKQLLYAKIFVLLVIATAISIIASHKLAGPIYRIEKCVDTAIDGDLINKMYLRTGDEMKAVSEKFNIMIDTYRNWIENDRKKITEIDMRLQKAETGVYDIETKKEIESARNELGGLLSNWKIKN